MSKIELDDKREDPTQHTTGAEREALEEREKFLEQIFNHTGKVRADNKAMIEQNFTGRGDKGFESRNPFMKRAMHATLSEQCEAISKK